MTMNILHQNTYGLNNFHKMKKENPSSVTFDAIPF